MRLGLLVLLTSVLLVSCGGDDGEPTAVTTTPETSELRVYFLLNGEVWPVRRLVGYTELIERAALDELVTGPTDEELEELMLSNEPFQTAHRAGPLFPSRARFQGLRSSSSRRSRTRTSRARSSSPARQTRSRRPSATS